MINNFTIYRYTFKHNFSRSRNPEKTCRKGYWISSTTPRGQRGFGEFCTIQGFGSSDRDLDDDIAKLFKLSLAEIDAIMTACMRREPINIALHQETLAGLQMTGLDLQAKTKSNSFGADFSYIRRNKIPVSQLVSNASAAIRAVQRGAKGLKLKVGTQSVEEDITAVQTIRAAVPRTVPLRIDVNQGWDLHTAQRFLEATQNKGIEWVEEPLEAASIQYWPQLCQTAHHTGQSLARDESITDDMNWHNFINAPDAEFIVIKPMFCGGLLGARDRAIQALKKGVQPCFSHAMESSLGRSANLYLASSLTRPVADGLYSDTLPPLGPNFRYENGIIQCLVENAALDLDSAMATVDAYEVAGTISGTI